MSDAQKPNQDPWWKIREDWSRERLAVVHVLSGIMIGYGLAVISRCL